MIRGAAAAACGSPCRLGALSVRWMGMAAGPGNPTESNRDVREQCRRLQLHLQAGTSMASKELDAALVLASKGARGGRVLDLLAAYLADPPSNAWVKGVSSATPRPRLETMMDLSYNKVALLLRVYAHHPECERVYRAVAAHFARRGWVGGVAIWRVLREFQERKLHVAALAAGMIERVVRFNANLVFAEDGERGVVTPLVILADYALHSGIDHALLQPLAATIAKGHPSGNGPLLSRLRIFRALANGCAGAASAFAVVQGEAVAALPTLRPNEAALCMKILVETRYRRGAAERSTVAAAVTPGLAAKLTDAHHMKWAGWYVNMAADEAACDVLVEEAVRRVGRGQPAAAAHILRDFTMRQWEDGREGEAMQRRRRVMKARAAPRLHDAVAADPAALMKLLADADAAIAYAEGVAAWRDAEGTPLSPRDHAFFLNLASTGSVQFLRSAKKSCLTELLWAYHRMSGWGVRRLTASPVVQALFARAFALLIATRAWRQRPIAVYHCALAALTPPIPPHHDMVAALRAAFADHARARLPPPQCRTIERLFSLHAHRSRAPPAEGRSGAAWRGSTDKLAQGVIDAWWGVLD